MSETTSIERGNIVQITDEAHAWYPALLIVGERKPWGVQAVTIVPESNDGSKPPIQYWNRLSWDQIERVGIAVVVPE